MFETVARKSVRWFEKLTLTGPLATGFPLFAWGVCFL